MNSVDAADLRAVILAAGRGGRLGLQPVPKPLLVVGGRSLLARHIDILGACGIRQVTVVIGHAADVLRAEVRALAEPPRIALVENPAFEEGSVVSLWHARSVLESGATVILMDADVLYDRRLMQRLLTSPHRNCFLVDRNLDSGDEPVKLCVAAGRIVDFHKRPNVPHEWHGESVGFFRFAPETAAELAHRAAEYVASGRRALEYEEPIRDMVVERAGAGFGFEDITGLPWTEIDFPEDVVRAREQILPELVG